MAPGSNDQWDQYYNQSFTPTPTNREAIISSHPNISLNVVTDQSFITTSSTTSHNNGGGMLTPTGSVAKPIRRRSRVSKKTPITLLNANATNFRSLVQQFTGCAAFSLPISTGSQKGPINLSFGANPSSTQGNTSSLFGNSNYSYNYQQHQQQQLQRLAQVQQHQLEEHSNKGMYCFDNVNSNNDHVFHYSSNSSSPGYNPMQVGTEIEDGFEIMDQEDVSLHELLD